ncbi:MAG: alanine racemase [Gammaproteobacteria bacterium]
MPPVSRARIDLGAISRNHALARRLAPNSRTLAVIKANAYGHGALAVARTLAGEADAFGVARLEEAAELRGAGIDIPILLLEGPARASEFAKAGRLGLWSAIHCQEQLQWFLDAGPMRPRRVWLKFDSGMHRLGFDVEGFRSAFARLRAERGVEEVVLMTHFARADEWTDNSTSGQIARFEAACEGLDAPRSLANSAGILAWPDSHGDWVRPGILLYGATPLLGPDAPTHDLSPVMHFESRVIAIRDLAAGESIGYGARYTAQRAMRMGVVAAGYGDGYPRAARDGTPVRVSGYTVPLAGRVSMDMLTVDLSEHPDVKVGDIVELWGEHVSANSVATDSGTIAYELFTRMTGRAERTYR